MEFYHSFWSKPLTEQKRWGEKESIYNNLIFMAASATYINKLGFNISMICDSDAADLFEGFPYKKVDVFLDKLGHIPTKCWAAGKIFSQKFIGIDDVLIDTDCIIRSIIVPEKIKLLGYDLVVQSEYKDYSGSMKSRLNICKNISDKYIKSLLLDPLLDSDNKVGGLSAGIIKWSNPFIRYEFITNYFAAVEELAHNKYFDELDLSDPYDNPDLILEQGLMHAYAFKYKFKINSIIDESRSHDMYPRYGLYHLGGPKKYRIIPHLEEELGILNPELLNKLQTKYKI